MQEEPGDSGNQESLTRGCLLGCWVLAQEALLGWSDNGENMLCCDMEED
jgi:hypothetical protein